MIRRFAKRLDFDLEYYLSGGSLLMVDQAVVLATGLATTWCFTNLMPKEVYGAYGFILAIAGWLALIALPGVSQAIQRSAARGFDGAFAVGARRRLKAGSIAGAVMFVTAVLLFAAGRGMEASGALVASVLFPFAYAFDDYRSVLFGKQRFAAYVVMHACLQVCVAAATITAIIAGVSFFAILAANMSVRAVGNAATYLLTRRRFIANDQVDEDFHRFGWNLSLAGIVGGTSYQLDRIIVGGLLGLEVMAAYELAFRLTDPLRNLGVFLNKLLFPRAVRVSGLAVASRFFSRVVLLGGAMAAAGLVITWLLDPVIHLLFPKYPEAVPLARWMAWSALIAVVLIYLETFYISQERFHRTYYTAILVRPIAIIVLLPVFIYHWGVFGAIWAKLVVRLAASVALFIKLGFDRLLLQREETAGEAENGPANGQRAPCPLCGDAVGRRHWRVRGAGGEAYYTLVQCRSCGLWRQEPPAPDENAGEAEGADAGEWSPGGLRRQRWRKRWLQWAAEGRPGPQQTGWPRYLAACWAGVCLRVLDRRGHPLAFDGAGKRLLLIGDSATNQVAAWTALGWRASAADWTRLADLPIEAYEAIVLTDGLERQVDPLGVLRRLRSSLNTNGVLVAHHRKHDGVLPALTAEYWDGLRQPEHRVVFSRGHLATAMRVTGWRVVGRKDRSAVQAWVNSLSLRLLGRRARPDGRLSRWLRFLRGPVWLLDLLGLGDSGYLIAKRDDRSAASWAPREIQEDRII